MAHSSYIKSKSNSQWHMNEHNSDTFSCSENLLLLFTRKHKLTIKHKIYWFSSLNIQLSLKIPGISLPNNFQLWLIYIICLRLPTESVFQSYFFVEEKVNTLEVFLKMSKHIKWGFSGSSVIQNPPANAGGCGFNSWVRMILWRRKWQPTPVFLPGKSHGQRNLEGYSPWVHEQLNSPEQSCKYFK